MNVLTFIELGRHRLIRLASPWGFNLDVYKASAEFTTVCCGADFYFQPATGTTHCVACGRDYVSLMDLEYTLHARDELDRLERAINAFTDADVLAASIHAHAAVEDLKLARSYLDWNLTLEELLDEVMEE